jgi:O-antigen/teichoic acid export membrane protein
MLLNLVVSLYTSRVVLNALGVEDYGIFNVIGGVVTMFSFLSGTMATATQRFLSFELGRNNFFKLKRTFESSNVLMFILALIVTVTIETIGLWLLNNKIVIPENRMYAAHWVLQCTTASLFISIISITYNASIIAHEKMSAFAYIGIFEVILRLGNAFIIMYVNTDKIILYAFLLLGSSILIRAIYITYCKKNFEECRDTHLTYDKEISKSMLSFFNWNTIGAFSYVAKEQGVNIVINMFSGLAVNAARGISSQVSGALYGFILNFQVAMNPQITKNYAIGDISGLKNLVYRGCKFSFFLFLFLALPVFVDTPYILEVWLKIVPDYTVSFIRLTIVLMLIETLASPLITSLLATGNVKIYQIIVGTMLILNLPVSYLLLKLGFSPTSTLYVAIVISVICLGIRIYLTKKNIGFPILEFLRDVLFKAIIVSATSAFISLMIHKFSPLTGMAELLLVCLVSWLTSAVLILYVGMNSSERLLAFNLAIKYSNKIFHRV